MGVLNFIISPVFVLAGHFSGIETIKAPSWEVIGFLTIDACFGIIYEFWLVRATTMIGPLTANVSLASIIPFTMVIDFFWTGHNY